MTIPLVLVAAVADNGVIGDDDKLIWRLKTDLKRFRTLTLGRPMIMGRKTFHSIGKPLPGRETVVLTRDPAFAFAGVHVSHDLEGAVATARDLAERAGVDSVAVVGGAEVYAQLLPSVERLYLTLVHARPAGDAVFPAYDPLRFRETFREEHPAGPDDEHAFTFVDLVRRNSHENATDKLPLR